MLAHHSYPIQTIFQIKFTSIVYYQSFPEAYKITHITKSVWFKCGNESETRSIHI